MLSPLDAITGVWSLGSIIIALIGGAATGTLLGRFLPPNPVHTGLTRLVTGFVVIGFIGAVFYVGQIIEAAAAGDPLWYRITSRACLWLLFAAALSIAGYLTPSAKAPAA